MDKIFVPNLNANDTMELVRELRAKGLVQGTDFNFAYQQTLWNDNYTQSRPHGAEFSFRDPKWVTFFRIKYGT